ncbi:MAG: hypothetical protein E6K70_21045 [Planctomycetota bacterium]|nr:MAG: hypothetical protein E6K70_21045 [Planctomycetota bacterium]
MTPASSESGSATVRQAPPGTAVAPSAPATAEPAASGPFHQLLNATKVSLEYQIEQQGPTGVSKVEVWVTRDTGNTWTCLLEDKKGHSPVEFELPGEGLYGVSLVVYNGNGVSSAVPAKGDAPDYLVEIDLTRPAAQLLTINPGVDKEAGTLLCHQAWRPVAAHCPRLAQRRLLPLGASQGSRFGVLCSHGRDRSGRQPDALRGSTARVGRPGEAQGEGADHHGKQLPAGAGQRGLIVSGEWWTVVG